MSTVTSLGWGTLLIVLLASVAPPIALGKDRGHCDVQPAAGQQCWTGTIKAHGQGNVYNDTVSMDFHFTVGADGVVTGKAHAKMTNAPQQFHCTTTRARTPDELDVAVSGRLVDNEFVLKLEEPVVPTTFTQCGQSHTIPTAFFAPMPLALDFKNPKVPAKDGATNSFDVVVAPEIHITGSIEVHQVASCECEPSQQMLQVAFDRAFAGRGIATPGQYLATQSTARDSMNYQIAVGSGLGGGYDLVPTSDETVSQIEKGNLPYPQPAGHSLLLGSVFYIDGHFRVNMRIDDLATGAILYTSKGDGGDCPDGLDVAVASALANLPVSINSYAPAQGPVQPH